MTESLDTLKEYLIDNPEDFSAWKMLGMTQVAIGDLDDSINSFENAFKINPDDIDLLLQYSSAIAAKQDGEFRKASRVN